MRVYSGHITAGTQVLNSTKGKKGASGLFQMHANKMPVEDATAGHISPPMIGLKDTTTGDTCAASTPIVLESMSFRTRSSTSLSGEDQSDQEKLGTAIRSSPKDPDLLGQARRETGQTVIGGMGELHLDILVDRMRREFKVEANVGKPPGRLPQKPFAAWSKHEYPQSRPVDQGSSPRSSSSSNRWSTPRTAPPTSSSMPSPVVAFRASTSRRWMRGTGRDAVRRARRLPARW